MVLVFLQIELHLSVRVCTHIQYVRQTQKVSQSNCFVMHWAAEMRFLYWWSAFDTPFFKPERDILCACTNFCKKHIQRSEV